MILPIFYSGPAGEPKDLVVNVTKAMVEAVCTPVVEDMMNEARSIVSDVLQS